MVIGNEPIIVKNCTTDMDLDSNVINAPNLINNEVVKKIATHNQDKDDINVQRFSDSFSGPIYVIIQSTNNSLNAGKLHPMKIGKLLHEVVHSIAEIKS